MHLKTLTPERQVSESGYRSYSSQLGRWPSRDPLGDLVFYDQIQKGISRRLEADGRKKGYMGSNLRRYVHFAARRVKKHLSQAANAPAYLFVQNAPVGRIDPLGLQGESLEGDAEYGAACCLLLAAANTRFQMVWNGIDYHDNEGGGNAFQHCLGACQGAKSCGREEAEEWWQGREQGDGISEQHDRANNEIGLGVADSGGSCWDGCMELWNNGGLQCRGGGQEGLFPCPPRQTPEPPEDDENPFEPFPIL